MIDRFDTNKWNAMYEEGSREGTEPGAVITTPTIFTEYASMCLNSTHYLRLQLMNNVPLDLVLFRNAKVIADTKLPPGSVIMVNFDVRSVLIDIPTVDEEVVLVDETECTN